MFSRNVLFSVKTDVVTAVNSIAKICKSRMIFSDGKQHMENTGP